MEQNKKISGALSPAQMLARRLHENKKSLHIARVPDKTKESFIALANAEFCGDYGMLLKFLIDDIPSQDMRAVVERLENHEERLNSLELTKPLIENKEESSRVKMLNGTKKVIRRLNKDE